MPVPVPARVTVNVKLCSAKLAVTVVAAVMVTVHVLVPEQPPPFQPVKVEPVVGMAVSVLGHIGRGGIPERACQRMGLPLSYLE